MIPQPLSEASRHKAWYIFCGVFLYSVLFLSVLRSIEGFIDAGVWIDQIEYLQNRDPRMINFFAAYGQPGTTILELGVLLHLLPGVSYAQSFQFSMNIITSLGTAACAAMASLIFRHPLAWVTAVFVLLPDRRYFMATPPTIAVIPLIVLITLATWWLWELRSQQPTWRFILLGGFVGISAATRLDATVLTGLMVIVVLWHRFGYRTVLLLIAGAVLSFFLADPYLWTSPVQHLADLVRKFAIHYGGTVMPIELDPAELTRAMVPATICFIWAVILLIRRRLSSFMPVPVMIGLSGILLLAFAVIMSSTTQNVRYLAPFLVTWEVILYALILESLASFVQKVQPAATSSYRTISIPLIGAFIVLHIILNLILRPDLLSNLLIHNAELL